MVRALGSLSTGVGCMYMSWIGFVENLYISYGQRRHSSVSLRFLGVFFLLVRAQTQCIALADELHYR